MADDKDKQKPDPNIWVVYDEAEQKWEVRRQNVDKPVSAHESKEEAVNEGRKLAERERGEFTVTKEDQTIEDHDTFGPSNLSGLPGDPRI